VVHRRGEVALLKSTLHLTERVPNLLLILLTLRPFDMAIADCPWWWCFPGGSGVAMSIFCTLELPGRIVCLHDQNGHHAKWNGMYRRV